MNIEKIKFETQEYNLVPAGVNLSSTGGTITFCKGSQSFDEIEAVLMAAKSITQIGLSGEPDWTRSDLVYTGRLTKQADYTIGTEQTQTGINDAGEPLYTITEVKADVMIAEFKTPDLASEVEDVKARLAATQETVDKLILTDLEG